MSVDLFLWGVAAQMAIAIFALTLPPAHSGRIAYAASLVVSVLLLILAAVYLGSGSAGLEVSILPLGLPWLGAHFAVDPLSAFFLVISGMGGAMASLYALGYGSHEREPLRVLPFYPIFLAAMNLVLLAADAFTFLFSFEFMSLVSWALVMANHRQEANARAGYVYLVMAGFGTLSLLLAFGLMSGPAGDYSFSAIREAAPVSPLASAAILALILLGAGSKAGLVPLHVWLPLAHPAAPSHVSALMSGVMTKIAVYGVVRVLFDLQTGAYWWESIAVLAIGGATALLGILHALMEADLKRLLAYSTIENIGIIFISLGLAMAFQSQNMGWAAALALTAALFHAFNHSLFKSLLFMGAGAVLGATGERNMERLGGLIHRMPATSLTFLIASISISALPPLNGFVSEWLAFQAVLQSPELPQWGLKVAIPAIGAVMAVSAALAAAAFVKAFGITFLGRPRSGVVPAARETDRFSLAAMILLAMLCISAGLMPGLIMDWLLAPVSVGLLDARVPQQAAPWLGLSPISDVRSSYNGLMVALFVAISALAAAGLAHRFGSREIRRGPAWDCGFPDPSPTAQYSALSFAQPLRRVFGPYAFAAQETVDMPQPGELRPAHFRLDMKDLVWSALYQPLAGAIGLLSTTLNYFQFLTIRRYLALVFLSLVSLLLVLALWG